MTDQSEKGEPLANQPEEKQAKTGQPEEKYSKKSKIKRDKAVERAIKYIVPPELRGKVLLFEAHFKASDDLPIMITGSTGVGKSLFLHILERLWKEENPNQEVDWANCAHFGGPDSDANIARSELFGYNAEVIGQGNVRGIQPGLVANAKGRMLILEEIGELPREIQAMLLTFIETGEFRGVGAVESANANVRIGGATNREENLREDFRYRFFPFYVPPIFKRRRDILYYLGAKFPEIIKSLSTREVMILLTYHWPGNVREIERVGRLLWRKRELISCLRDDGDNNDFKLDYKRSSFYDEERLDKLGEQDTAIDASKLYDFVDILRKGGVDTDALESLLNSFGIGIYGYKDRIRLGLDTKAAREGVKKPFEAFEESDLYVSAGVDERLNVRRMKVYKPFEKAFQGYELFCSLFLQAPDMSENNITGRKGFSMEFYYPLKRLPSKDRKKCQGLMNSTFEFKSGIKLAQGQNIPEAYEEREILFNKLSILYPSNEFLHLLTGRTITKKDNEEPRPDIYAMPYDEFMKQYHERLFEKVGGNVKKAAEMINENYSTLRSRLMKYGIIT
ncbi:MAG: sigma 54-interacting transcriptional regulator [Syntrophus sp. (in: bacteria)]